LKNRKVKLIRSLDIKNTPREKVIAEGLADFLDVDDIDYIISETYGSYEYAYLFFDEFKSNQIISYMERAGILIDHQDITEQVLNSTYKTKEWLTSIDFPENFYRLEIFLKENLSLDIILDKINREGIISLYPVELEILSEFRED
jgi:hypothetical protein